MQKIYLKKITITCFLTAIAVAGFISAGAQITTSRTADYIFTSYNASDGLPSPEIISLETDKKGFLWAGTAAGLSRYDGYSFTNFTHSADNFLIGVVNVIKTGTAGKLWIGSSSGLYCYSANRLIKVSTETNVPQGINDIIAEADGSLWLTTDGGPAFIKTAAVNEGFGTKIMLKNFLLVQWTEKFASLYGPQCRFIKKAPDGTIYFSNQYQLFRFTQERIELLFTATTENDKMEYVFASGKAKVYFNTSVTGLHKIENEVHENFRFSNLYQPRRKPVSEGDWYVGSLGLVCFHPDEEFISASIDFNEAGAQWMSAVLRNKKTLWLATHSGLIKIKPSPFNLYKNKGFEAVQESFSFWETQQGKFLVGVNHGKIYELTAKGVKEFLPPPQQPVQHAEIKCMYEDQRGWLWIGTGYQGLAVFKNGATTRFTSEKNNLHDNSFSSFLTTNNGRLYAIGDKGMTEIAVDEKGIPFFRPYYSRPGFTQFAKFYGGIEAPDGTVWIAGEEGIRYLRNDSLVNFSFPGKKIIARDIKLAADKSVWIATLGEGIFCCRFDARGMLQLVKQYDASDGLNTVQFLDLLIDREDNIWAGSVKGISLIRRSGKQNNRPVNFSEADGFIKPGYYTMQLHQDNKGAIWAGTSLGIASFMPNELSLRSPPPGIYITGIDFFKLKERIDGNDSAIVYNNLSTPSFSYTVRSLNFNYAAIDNEGTANMQYYYKMDGLDTNWVDAGQGRSATYHNLPPGHYKFSVKAVSEKGIESSSPAAFAFVIEPPFWKTLWFRLSVLVTSAGMVWLVIRRRINGIKVKAAAQQQLTELEVKALRAQMNPHFIFNAINSIQQFTLDNDIDSANLYLSRFSTLLRKVLHSSKENFIVLEEELEQLKLYLEIESLRMGPDFHFQIQVAQELEPDALKIPGMLIQPFAENALKHGLAPKEGPKELKIEVLFSGDDHLKVVITDNGVGRKEAGRLKLLQEKLLVNDSKGISLVEERLRLLRKEDIEGMLRMDDLFDEDGEPAGTRVTVLLRLYLDGR